MAIQVVGLMLGVVGRRRIRRGLFARMFLQNSELFLLMAAKNPDLKLEDLAAFEKTLASGGKDSS